MISGFRKENLAQNDVANLVRNLENKLSAGNIRKLLIELMLRKQNIVGWPSGRITRSVELMSQESNSATTPLPK
jgi:hypothetical protein